MKLDLTSKVVNRESPSNISGRLPVSVLKLAENVSFNSVRMSDHSSGKDKHIRYIPRLTSALNSVGMEPNTPGFLAIVKDPVQSSLGMKTLWKAKAVHYLRKDARLSCGKEPLSRLSATLKISSIKRNR